MRFLYFFISVVLLIGCSFINNSAQQYRGKPGFDCQKAVTEREKTICSDEELKILDFQENQAFQKKLQNVALEDEKEIRKKAGDKLRAQNDLYKMTSLSSEKKKEILKKIYKSKNDFYSPLFLGVLANPDEITPEKITDLRYLAKRSDQAKAQYLIYSVFHSPEQLKQEPAASFAQQLRSKFKDREVDDNCLFSRNCLFRFINRNVSDVTFPCEAIIDIPDWFSVEFTGVGLDSHVKDKTTCHEVKKYKYPEKVGKYIAYINDQWDFGYILGSIRYILGAAAHSKRLRDQFQPFVPKEFEETNLDKQGLPLERWALLSYPNFKEWKRVLKDFSEFKAIQNELAAHYVKVFGVSEKEAEQYALYALTPFSLSSSPAQKDTVRYMILNDVPSADIFKKILSEKKNLKEPSFLYEEDSAFSYDGTRMMAPVLSVAIARPDVLEFLIENCSDNRCGELNAQVDATDYIGKTALMYAAQFGFLDSVKILLQHGADINKQMNGQDIYAEIFNNNRTALMYALQEGHEDVAEYLARHGADLTVSDSQDKDAYDYLIGNAPKYDPYTGTRPGERHYKGQWKGLLEEKKKGNPKFTAEQIAKLTPLVRSHLYNNMYQVSDPLDCRHIKTKADKIVCMQAFDEKSFEFQEMVAAFKKRLEEATDKEAVFESQNKFKEIMTEAKNHFSSDEKIKYLLKRRTVELSAIKKEKIKQAEHGYNKETREKIEAYSKDISSYVQTQKNIFWGILFKKDEQKSYLVKFDPVKKKELERYFLFNTESDNGYFQKAPQSDNVFYIMQELDLTRNPHLSITGNHEGKEIILRFDANQNRFTAYVIPPLSLYEMKVYENDICISNEYGCDCFDPDLKKLVYVSEKYCRLIVSDSRF